MNGFFSDSDKNVIIATIVFTLVILFLYSIFNSKKVITWINNIIFPNDDDKYNNLASLLKWSAIITFAVFAFGLLAFKFTNLKINNFGDFFGGTITPILTFFTFVGLLITIVHQRQELELTRKELASSSQALQEQVKTQELQRFENTFMSLLKLHNKTHDGLLSCNSNDVMNHYAISNIAGDTFIRKYDIHFCSLESIEQLPSRGKCLVVLALVKNNVHIRIFDSYGKMVKNKNESEIINATQRLLNETKQNLLQNQSSLDSWNNNMYSTGKLEHVDKVFLMVDYTLTERELINASVQSLKQHSRILTPYFIVLYQMLKYIATNIPREETDNTKSIKWEDFKIKELPECTKREKKYSNIVRSFLANEILQLLAVNCYCNDKNGFHDYQALLERYEFLEHMSFEVKYPHNCIDVYNKRLEMIVNSYSNKVDFESDIDKVIYNVSKVLGSNIYYKNGILVNATKIL